MLSEMKMSGEWKSQTVLWLPGETLKDNFNFVHRQTDRQTNPDKPLLNCSFAVKNKLSLNAFWPLDYRLL